MPSQRAKAFMGYIVFSSLKYLARIKNEESKMEGFFEVDFLS